MKNWSLLLVLFVILVGACSSDPNAPRPKAPNIDDNRDPLKERRDAIREARLNAEQLYRRSRASLDTSDFIAAVESYDSLTSRFPFSDFTTQGELERIYALYRNFEHDRALSSADRFLREHPRHADVDYIYYLKGLVNYDRDASGLNILPSDETKSDVTSQRRAFDDFALLIQKYPKSRYNGDAYERMVFIRNRLAAHELHVVDFYLRRGAYVAAAKRAEQVIAQYPGAPASYRALDMLVTSYERAGMQQQATDARTLRAAQDQTVATTDLVPKETAAAAPPTTAAPPITAATPITAAAPSATPQPEKRGLLARIGGLFFPSDSTDGGFGIVIPSSKTKSQETAPASAGAPASGSGTESTAASIPAEATGEKKGNKLEVYFEPYDEAAPAPAPKPEPAAAPATAP